MFVERILAKLSKWLGGDPTGTRWYNAPIKRFTFETLQGVVTVEGHDYERDGSDVIVYEITDEGWALATLSNFGGDMAVKALNQPNAFKDVKRVQNVGDISEEEIGETTWDITVNMADATIEKVDRTELIQ